MDKDSLLMKLLAYAEGDIYPLHMPGHKRNRSVPGGCALPYAIDVTETADFDDLHAAKGILQEGMDMAAELYRSRRAFYLVGGSTCGLLASIRAMTRRGDKILVAQNCHRSVFHAIEICGLFPLLLSPVFDSEFGIYGSVSPTDIRRALTVQTDIRLVVLTSPTYEGVISDISSIAELLHERGIPLLVDEAHGAHLGLSAFFPKSAVTEGADVVVQSLHKTLSGLTQTALLHVCTSRVDDREIERQLAIFETSSPSYPLMASIDVCIRLMRKDGSRLLEAHRDRLAALDDAISGLQHLRLMGHGNNSTGDALFCFDPSKLLISARKTNLSGRQVMDRLLSEHHLQLEMAMGDNALAMTTAFDTDEGFARITEALIRLDAACIPALSIPPRNAFPTPTCVMPPDAALSMPGEMSPFGQCAGRVSREYVFAYPPGIPVILPGQLLDLDTIDAIIRWDNPMRSTRGQMPDMLEVAVC